MRAHKSPWNNAENLHACRLYSLWRTKVAAVLHRGAAAVNYVKVRFHVSVTHQATPGGAAWLIRESPREFNSNQLGGGSVVVLAGISGHLLPLPCSFTRWAECCLHHPGSSAAEAGMRHVTSRRDADHWPQYLVLTLYNINQLHSFGPLTLAVYNVANLCLCRR